MCKFRLANIPGEHKQSQNSASNNKLRVFKILLFALAVISAGKFVLVKFLPN